MSQSNLTVKMLTEQKYDAPASSATAPASIEPAAQNTLQPPTTGEVERLTEGIIPQITLHVSAGNQFHHLFFALLQAHREVLEDAIVDFDPNQLEHHVKTMDSAADIEDLLVDLVTGLNFTAIEYEKQWMGEQIRMARLTSGRDHFAREIAKWQEKARHHYTKREG